MKPNALYVLLLILVGCSVQVKTNAQFYGMESNGDGSYTIWMGGGSVTTNTQGQYSVTNNQGTYCNGCYAQAQYGYSSSSYYSPTYPYQPLAGTPPASYASTQVVGGNIQVYYNSSGQVIAQIPFGTNYTQTQTVIGYGEGCTSCAQQQAQTQASNQWNASAYQAYQQQSYALQQVQIANMQAQMAEAYNTSNTYNYYYFYYAIQILTGGTSSAPLPPPPPTPPPPAPPVDVNPQVNSTPAKLPAELQGNRTYVTPGGTPFTLPSGAEVASLPIDMGDFTNGALYTFYVNGVQYVAYESFYSRNTGMPAKFGGYYELKSDGSLDLTKPFPATSANYPATPGSTLNVVKLSKKTTPAGCSLLQEIVSYTMGDVTPTSLPAPATPQSQNTDIESTSPVPGTPTNTCTVGCPTAPTNNDYSGAELNAFAKSNPYGGTGRLQGFLNVFMTKNTAKIYLFDNTGKVKYTVTKEGVTELNAQQSETETAKYNNGNFQSTDQDFAIKGLLNHGKWEYEVKWNDSKLTPNSKVAPVLQDVKDEIKRQADDEVSKLKSVNIRTQEESITVDGETSRKIGMDIFETLCAVYDVGKDIINDGKMPEKIWDSGKRGDNTTVDQTVAAAHGKSPFQMGTIISGCADKVIDEATGAVQLAKTALEFARHPVQTVTTIYKGVKSLDKNKIQQMISDASGVSNLNQGGDRAKYQGGRYAVQIAAIIISGVKNLLKGADLVKQAGENITDMQKFIPDGTTGHPVANALKNAADNNLPAKAIDEKKLLARNKVEISAGVTEERYLAIEKNGDIYESKAVNNLDDPGIGDDVKKAADAGDLAEAADDAVVHNQMKNQPQQFKDGKAYENRMIDDPTTKTNVGTKAGIDLSGHQKLKQVQLKTSDGNFFIADEVYVKKNPATGNYDVVINEMKLSDQAPFTTRQEKFLDDLHKGQVEFDLRNTKFDKQEFGNITQGSKFNVQAMIKTQGNGTVQGPSSFFKYDPVTKSWQ